MRGKLEVLLIGDDTKAKWHPLEPVRRQLETILDGGDLGLTSTEDYNQMIGLDQGRYSLCISYTDCWDRKLASEQASGLLQFVKGGGGLLVIHNGISLQQNPELLQMIGAKFTGHPPYGPLHYYSSNIGHPIMEGVDDFSMEEEPYMFDFNTGSAVSGSAVVPTATASAAPAVPDMNGVFLEFEYEGKRYPAAWAHRFGLGNVVYLQPGHHAPSFESTAYRQVIRNSARWAVDGNKGGV